MENFKLLIMLSDASLMYYVIDFIVMFGIMAGLRWYMDSLSDISIKDLLAKHDNFAVGITVAGAMIAVAILMMGVVSGDAGQSYVDELTLMVVSGVMAIALMAVTRKIFDKIILSELNIHDGIMNGNMGAAIIDAGNMIATAIIVRSAMTWVDGTTYLGLAMVLVIYVISQLLMMAATAYRMKVFASRHNKNDRTFASEINGGNMALAIRFAGHRIGVALAVTATSGVVIYAPDLMVWSIASWGMMAVVMFVAQTMISVGMRHAILPGINVGEEVGEQRNIAIGSIEAAVYIGVGFAFVGLLG